MRAFMLSLVVFGFAASLTPAQQPQQPPAPTVASSAQLDAVLAQWEKQMQGVQTLAAQLTRTTVNRVFNTTDIYEGGVKFMKPNRALFDLRKKGDPQVFERIVFTDANIYEFRPQDKTLRIHQPPPRKPGQVTDDNIMAFVFGMKADEAKRRYDMSLHKPEDPNYYYIAVQPRAPQDRQDFVSAWLILLKRNYLPRQFRYTEPNKNEIMYDIPSIELNGKSVVATDFAPPQAPSGWKTVQVPRPTPQPEGNVPPRVVRPNR